MFENSDFLGALATAFSILASILLFKLTPKYQLVRERYEKLIFPLFSTLEPYLFKNYNEDAFKKALNIIETNKPLAGGKLLEIFYYCKSNNSKENYYRLCRYINFEYDKSCARLGLRQRSILYRLQRDQYQTKFMLILYVIFGILFFVFGLFVFLLFIGIISIVLDKLGFLPIPLE